MPHERLRLQACGRGYNVVVAWSGGKTRAWLTFADLHIPKRPPSLLVRVKAPDLHLPVTVGLRSFEVVRHPLVELIP